MKYSIKNLSACNFDEGYDIFMQGTIFLKF
jgi:hypothetical protein